MKTLHFSAQINAPREKVWEVMLGAKTYTEWTAVFAPEGFSGSTFVGDWNKGSRVQFISTDDKGVSGGMASQIAESKRPEFLSIQHLGLVMNGVEDITSEEAKQWVGFENYTFNAKDGGTELVVDVDTNDIMVEEMSAAWPKALAKLKEMAEK